MTDLGNLFTILFFISIVFFPFILISIFIGIINFKFKVKTLATKNTKNYELKEVIFEGNKEYIYFYKKTGEFIFVSNNIRIFTKQHYISQCKKTKLEAYLHLILFTDRL